MALSIRRVPAFLILCASLLVVVPGSTLSAAPTSGCVDWRDYASDMAPAGSDNLGLGGTANDQAAGSAVTLTDILGRNIDLSITWSNAHDGQILDEGLTADFNGVGDYLAAVGGPNTQTVFRYFPAADDHGTVTFEFFEGGTSTPALVQVDHLLIGGQRKFNGVGWGTSEWQLRAGGASVAATFANNDLEGTDADGGANGVTGAGTTPIVQLDTANFSPNENTSAYIEARNSFATVGQLAVRDWTLLDWGNPLADTIVWDLYSSGVDADPQPDPETVDPANFTLPHWGLSSYLSGLCLTVHDYDLALAKVSSGYDSATGNATFEVTVNNQGSVGSGAFTVTDQLPPGTTFVSADNGGVASGGIVTWTIPSSAALSPGEARVFTVVAHIDDPALSPFVNRAEISADSGPDCDSSPDTNLVDDALVDVTDPGTLVGGGCDAGSPDEDDNDIASLVVSPPAPTTTTPTTAPPTSASPETTVGQPDTTPASDSPDTEAVAPPGSDETTTTVVVDGQGGLPVTGSNSGLFLIAGLFALALGMLALDGSARLAWRTRLAAIYTKP